jgi:hypothetical protein
VTLKVSVFHALQQVSLNQRLVIPPKTHSSISPPAVVEVCLVLPASMLDDVYSLYNGTVQYCNQILNYRNVIFKNSHREYVKGYFNRNTRE